MPLPLSLCHRRYACAPAQGSFHMAFRTARCVPLLAARGAVLLLPLLKPARRAHARCIFAARLPRIHCAAALPAHANAVYILRHLAAHFLPPRARSRANQARPHFLSCGSACVKRARASAARLIATRARRIALPACCASPLLWLRISFSIDCAHCCGCHTAAALHRARTHTQPRHAHEPCACCLRYHCATRLFKRRHHQTGWA